MILKYLVQQWRYNPNIKRIVLANDHSENVLNEWLSDFHFFAISPLVRPISQGMNLFEIKHSTVWPYGIRSIKPVSNVFIINPESTYFIGYNEPVANTFELDLSIGARCAYDTSSEDSRCRNVFVLDKEIDRFVCGKTPQSNVPICIPDEDGEEFYKCIFKCVQLLK